MAWENLLPSCIDCNRRRWQDLPKFPVSLEQLLAAPEMQGAKASLGKQDMFPIAGADRATVDHPDIDEQPDLLNPCVDDPEMHLAFHIDRVDPLGLVLPRFSENVPSRRGLASIHVYGLNRLGLVQERTRVLRKLEFLSRLIDEIGEISKSLLASGTKQNRTMGSRLDLLVGQILNEIRTLGEYDRRREKPGTFGETRVTLPSKAGQGQLLPTQEFSGLIPFVFALFDSAKDWQDSLQSILAGYRERIATVNLKREEGGLNLNMQPERIDQLAGFGEEAGNLITTDFELNEHKWRRYLVEIRAIDEMLRQFADAHVERPEPGSLGYAEIATDYEPSSYKDLTVGERQALRERAEAIAALGKAFQELQPLDGFDKHLPKSRSQLRSVARMDY